MERRKASRSADDVSAITCAPTLPTFPLGTPPDLPAMPLNPFLNHSVPLSNPWERFFFVLMLPVAVVRLGLFLSAGILASLAANFALLGARSVGQEPLPRWRRYLLAPLAGCARLALFACGYNWIRVRYSLAQKSYFKGAPRFPWTDTENATCSEVKGRAAKREEAPVVVCNHVSACEPLFLCGAHLPMVVTAAENLHLPFVGVLVKALQAVVVDRSSQSSSRDAGEEIMVRAQSNEWPQVLIFPEATTTNGRALVSFKTGAFAPGVPVQPVVVKYPHTRMDPAWVADGMSTPLLLLRLMTQPHNQMTVEYLEPIVPTEEEQQDKYLFAERCRQAMAAALNVTVTEHAFGDTALILEGQRLGLPMGSVNLEFRLFERLYGLTLLEAKGLLRLFADMDVQKRGEVSYEEFLVSLGLAHSVCAQVAFHTFDCKFQNRFDLRQFVATQVFVSRHPSFPEYAASLFATLDRDGDGLLSATDISSGIAQLCPDQPAAFADGLVKAMGLGKGEALGTIGEGDFFDFMRAHPHYLALLLASQVWKL